MKQVLLVFVGGGIGSVLRYMIGKRFISDTNHFPWATFSVNLIGSFIIGALFGYFLIKQNVSNQLYLLLIAGFCGGFTTFSAFTHESLLFLRSGQTKLFFLYIVSSVLFGVFCVWLGYMATTKLI